MSGFAPPASPIPSEPSASLREEKKKSAEDLKREEQLRHAGSRGAFRGPGG